MTVAIKVLPLLAVIVVASLLRLARAAGARAAGPGADHARQYRGRDRPDLVRLDRLRSRDGSGRQGPRSRRATIPRALIGGTAFVALIYLFAGTRRVQMLLPAESSATSLAPFADAHRRPLGRRRRIFSPRWRSRSARSARSTADPRHGRAGLFDGAARRHSRGSWPGPTRLDTPVVAPARRPA